MWRLSIGAESLVFAFAGERETRASLHALSWTHKHSMKSGKECQGHHSCPVLKTQQKAGVEQARSTPLSALSEALKAFLLDPANIIKGLTGGNAPHGRWEAAWRRRDQLRATS